MSGRRLRVGTRFVGAALRREEVDEPLHRVVVRMTDECGGFAHLRDEADRDQRL